MSARARPPEAGAFSLPPQYAAALALAEAMLEAARADDWPRVRTLRLRVPALARALSRRWAAMPTPDAVTERRVEAERLRAIRRVLAVDAELRLLAAPSQAPFHAWLNRSATDRPAR